MGLLHVLTAARAVLRVSIRLHHEASLDCIQALGSCRGVRYTVHGSRRCNMEIGWLLLPVELVIHNDCVHVLAWGGPVLLLRCHVLVYVFLRGLRGRGLRVEGAHLAAATGHEDSLRARARHSSDSKLRGQHFLGDLRVSVVRGDGSDILQITILVARLQLDVVPNKIRFAVGALLSVGHV